MTTVFALLPAAGHSTRMGRPKLSLPLAGRTVIEHVVGTLRESGVQHILVVVGPHVAELVPLATEAGASVHSLVEQTPDMRATVEAGLHWIESNWKPADGDAFLLVPADHPVLSAEVVKEMLVWDARRDIIIPTYQGRRGHPTLIGWRHTAGIKALPPNLGLNSYLRRHAEAVREVSVASETILLDLDTPEDYEQIRARLQ